MTYLDWNIRTMPRAQRRVIRRRVRSILVILAVVFGSIAITVLAWLVFVMPHATPF